MGRTCSSLASTLTRSVVFHRMRLALMRTRIARNFKMRQRALWTLHLETVDSPSHQKHVIKLIYQRLRRLKANNVPFDHDALVSKMRLPSWRSRCILNGDGQQATRDTLTRFNTLQSGNIDVHLHSVFLSCIRCTSFSLIPPSIIDTKDILIWRSFPAYQARAHLAKTRSGRYETQSI